MRLTTGALASAAGAAVLAACGRGPADAPTTTEKAAGGESSFPSITRRLVTTQDPPNTFEQITGYNNFYEFGTGKGDPKQYAGRLITKPWTVTIDGLCNKPGDYHLEDLIKAADARGADLPAPLRRGVVDGDPVGRRAARVDPESCRADGQGSLCRVYDRPAPQGDAGCIGRRAELAVQGGSAARRGD